MVCVVGRMRDLILQLSKSSIYSTKPFSGKVHQQGNMSWIPFTKLSHIVKLSLELEKETCIGLLKMA
ncbi:hypothetical protein RAF64_16300, partial [Klebsiella quasipneumoniae subsp. similipneumoniae]